MAKQSRSPGKAHPILLTRPGQQGHRFADALREVLGPDARIVLSPLLVPRFLSPMLPAMPFNAVIFTSETGVAASRHAWPADRLPRVAWCVGDTTAAAARAAGFEARSAAGDAEALFRAILASGETGPLVHLRGTEVRGDLADRLTAAGIRTEAAIIYAQDPAPLSAAAINLLAGPGPVIVPLFSPRTAQLFCAAIADVSTCPIRVAAISPAVAAALGAFHPDDLAVAETPDARGMLATTLRLACA